MPENYCKRLPQFSRRDADRFWSKVYVRDEFHCWLWKGKAKTSGGYGRFGVSGMVVAAHRAAFRLFWGSDPYPQIILHHCDNPLCVSPHCLKLGDHADNVADTFKKGRMPIRTGPTHWRYQKEPKPVATHDYATKRLPDFTRDKADRFWRAVDIKGPDECWPWQLSLNKYGYGQFSFDRVRRALRVPRVAFYLWYGGDPFPSDILHRCDNRACCNPEHYFLGDRKVNAHDRDKKGRTPKGAASPHTDLCDDDIRDIKQRKAEGERARDIADYYRLSVAHVYRILDGTYWGSVK